MFEITEKLKDAGEKPENKSTDAEAQEDLAKLAQEKVANATMTEKELRADGQKRLAEIQASFADIENEEAIREASKKLEAISGKARTLLQDFRNKMKMVTAIGMSAIILSGIPGMETKNAYGGIKTQEKNEIVVNDLSDIDISNIKPGSVIKTKNVEIDWDKFLNAILEKRENAINAISENVISEKRREKARKDLMICLENISKHEVREILNNCRKNVSSPEYLKKLQIEFNGSLKKAKDSQRRRIAYLDFVEFSFVKGNLDSTSTTEKSKNNNRWMPQWLFDLIKPAEYDKGYYYPLQHKIVLPEKYDVSTVEHEIRHASTRGDIDISEKAKNILENSFEGGNIKEEYIEYLSCATERLARKQQLEHEMEILGIKKYGEKFTSEHYKKLMYFYEKGKLSRPSFEFIKTTKPEYFEIIFNEIAQNEMTASANIQQA
jgi:hypothetical protein